MTNSASRTKRPYIDRGNPLAKHVVCALPLYEGAGLTAHDISGRNRHWTLSGGATFGRHGIDQDGVNDVVIAELPSYGYPISFGCFVTLDALSTNRCVCSYNANGGAFAYFTINTDPTKFAITKRDTTAYTTSGTTTIVAGKEYHVVAVYATDTRAVLYVNGTEEAVNTDSLAMPSFNRFYVGRVRSTDNLWALNGIVRSPFFVNTALSPSQVRELYRNPNYLWGPPSRLAPYLIQDAGGVVGFRPHWINRPQILGGGIL